nr:MAG TPA: HTH-type transcriptional regulator [Caudoviricetes sp.]
MNIKDRLLEFLKLKNLSQSKFEKSINASNGYVNSMRKGIGSEKLEQIRTIYPELNIEWLITGSGEMLKQSSGRDSINISNTGTANVSNTGKMGNVNTSDERVKELELLLLERDAEIKSLKSTIEMLIQSIKK